MEVKLILSPEIDNVKLLQEKRKLETTLSNVDQKATRNKQQQLVYQKQMNVLLEKQLLLQTRINNATNGGQKLMGHAGMVGNKLQQSMLSGRSGGAGNGLANALGHGVAGGGALASTAEALAAGGAANIVGKGMGGMGTSLMKLAMYKLYGNPNQPGFGNSFASRMTYLAKNPIKAFGYSSIFRAARIISAAEYVANIKIPYLNKFGLGKGMRGLIKGMGIDPRLAKMGIWGMGAYGLGKAAGMGMNVYHDMKYNGSSLWSAMGEQSPLKDKAEKLGGWWSGSTIENARDESNIEFKEGVLQRKQATRASKDAQRDQVSNYIRSKYDKYEKGMNVGINYNEQHKLGMLTVAASQAQGYNGSGITSKEVEFLKSIDDGIEKTNEKLEEMIVR